MVDRLAMIDFRTGDILRTDAMPRRARQIDENDLRIVNIVRICQQLLNQLRTALADRDRSERAIARMTSQSKDHPTASAHHLPLKLMNNRQIRRNVYAAESARG